MFKISSSEKRSLLEGLLIVLVALALVFGYQAATERLFLLRQNHLQVVIACVISAGIVLFARLQMR